MPNLTGTPLVEKCYWCGLIVPNVTGHNRVHVGGENDVVGCDSCLQLKPVYCKYSQVQEVCNSVDCRMCLNERQRENKV